MWKRILASFFVLAAATLYGQATSSIQATGSATVTVNPPEQAQFTVGVVTEGKTADEAVQQNAAISNTVQSALQSLLGVNGTLQTVTYSVYASYSNTLPQTIAGYGCNNTVMVTTYNISNIGKLIDAASGAGANSIGGISFGLRNPDPYVQQALAQASKQALAYAAAIAGGLGGKTGAVLSAQQGYSYTPVATSTLGAGPSSTPVQTGGVTVTATVTVSVQLVQ